MTMLAPNQRLHVHPHLQSWYLASSLERIPTPKASLDISQAIHMLQLVQTALPTEQLAMIKKMRSLARQSSQNCACLQEAGIVHVLTSIFKEDTNIEEIISTLALFEIDVASRVILMSPNCIQSTSRVLYGCNLDAKIGAANILECLAKDVETKVKLGSNYFQVIEGLVKLLKEEDRMAIQSSMKALIQISQFRKNRPKLISQGVVGRLIELLSRSEKETTELVLSLLHLLCRTPEGRIEFGNNKTGMAIVSKKLIRVSRMATENAVATLWEICYNPVDEMVRKRAMEARIFEKLLLLLQLDMSQTTRSKVADLLKILAKAQS